MATKPINKLFALAELLDFKCPRKDCHSTQSYPLQILVTVKAYFEKSLDRRDTFELYTLSTWSADDFRYIPAHRLLVICDDCGEELKLPENDDAV